MDLRDPDQMNTLRRAYRDNREKMRNACNRRREAWESFVGPYYGPAGSSDGERRPINNIEKGLSIYTYHLVGGIPQMQSVAKADALRPLAKAGSITINEELLRREVGRVFKRWVRATIMGMGIVHLGWQEFGEVRHPLTGELLATGQWMLDVVSMDDLIIDFANRTLEAGEFMGHLFEANLQEAQENRAYDRKARAALTEKNMSYNTDMGTSKTETLSRGSTAWTDTLRPKVLLAQLYLRETNELVIFDPDGSGPALSQEPFIGPAEGPYRWIVHNEVEDNPIPLAPVQTWRDLDEIGNRIMNKLATSAINQKDVLGYEEGADDEVEDILSTPHMGAVGMRNPKAVQMYKFNGPDQMLLAMLLQVLEMENDVQGNPNLLAGLSQQADTATQENILSDAAGARMEAMRDDVTQGIGSVLQGISWYYWNDPVRVYTGEQTIAGTEYRLPIEITPAMRAGTWQRLNFELIPYSLKPTPPAQRLAQLRAMMSEMLALQPMLDAQGIVIKVDAYLDLAARYLHMPEIRELFEFGTPRLEQGENPAKPANTTRTYRRENVPTGGTPQARTAAKIQGLMSSANQQQQTALLQPGAV